MTSIPAHQLQPGDAVVDPDGDHHHVTHIDHRPGWSFPVAFDDRGWALALGCRPILVDREAA